MSTPPFDPPYISRIVTDGVERWVEVSADGTQTNSVPASRPLNIQAVRTERPQPVDQTAKPAVKFLNVPYAEKDDAKRLGARWDAARRKWYIPPGVDPAAFARWEISTAS